MAHISESGQQLLKMMLDKNYLSRASSKTLVQHPWIRNALSQRITLEMKENAAASLALYNVLFVLILEEKQFCIGH